MAKSKRTLAQTDEIVKRSATVMENTAAQLDKIARNMEAVLGSTKAVGAIIACGMVLRSNARRSLGNLK